MPLAAPVTMATRFEIVLVGDNPVTLRAAGEERAHRPVDEGRLYRLGKVDIEGNTAIIKPSEMTPMTLVHV
jgi:hypothetical protein